MKSTYLLFVAVLALVAGCVTGSSALDQSKAVSLTHIHIIPVEGPPLHGAVLSRAGLSGIESIAIGATTGSTGLLVVGGVLMMATLPEADARSAEGSHRIESLLDGHEIWEPTVEIAEQARRQLEGTTTYSISVDSEIKPLPGVERREATVLMENWLAPVRAWYNADPSSFAYSDQPSSGAVLEVGLSNYELSGDHFLIQVMMKMVDQESGAVIANARKAAHPKVDDLDSLFEDDAAGFKRLFRETTATLAQECIEKLGLREP